MLSLLELVVMQAFHGQGQYHPQRYESSAVVTGALFPEQHAAAPLNFALLGSAEQYLSENQSYYPTTIQTGASGTGRLGQRERK